MDTSALISVLVSSGILNILINGTVIYCIFTKSPKYMKDYRWFILNITIADLLYGIHSGLIFQFRLVVTGWFIVLYGIKFLDFRPIYRCCHHWNNKTFRGFLGRILSSSNKPFYLFLWNECFNSEFSL